MKKAFTLIELLIVVAIIAILAAIAVPNFLEAQTRAKVSRVTADQRTYATGLETYYIDNNSYPVYFASPMKSGTGFPYATVPANVKNYNNAIALAAGNTVAATAALIIPTFALPTNTAAIGLTSPVSYLNTYVPDTFAATKGFTFGYVQGSAGFLLFSPGPNGVDAFAPSQAGEIIVNGGQSLPSPYLVTGPATSAPKPAGALASGVSFTYEPTNGTASEGNVYRTK